MQFIPFVTLTYTYKQQINFIGRGRGRGRGRGQGQGRVGGQGLAGLEGGGSAYGGRRAGSGRKRKSTDDARLGDIMTAAVELGSAADVVTLFCSESIKIGPILQTVIALRRSYVGSKELARRTAPKILCRPSAPDAVGLASIAA